MLVTPLTEDFGAIVEATPGESIFDIDRDKVIDLIKTRAAVVFKGYAADGNEFNRFTSLFSDDYMSYKGGGYIRKAVSDNQDDTLLSTRYDYGREKQDTFGLPLHGEMYYVDHRPILLWFYCVQPAASDGETTICDGTRIYNRLSPKWQELLQSQRLKYLRQYQDGEWQKIYQSENPHDAVEFCKFNGISATFEEATKILRTEYVYPAIVNSRWGNHTVYINNILPVVWQENMGRETSVVRLEDGSKIPQEMIDEVVAIQQQEMIALAWKPQEFAVLDNTRTLHGRRAFTDTDRDVYLRMVRTVPF